MASVRVNDRQLELDWRDEDSLRAELESHSGKPVQLVVTDNTSSVISFKHMASGEVRVRLHRMFLSAGPHVVSAVGTWIRTPRAKEAARTVNRFIRENLHQVRPSKPKPVDVVSKGRFFDLEAIYRELNDTHFEGRISASITWGRMPRPGRRRTIRFGSYHPMDKLIRIHPLLDQSFVPQYFVRYIVFHEMLHADLGIEELDDGRRLYHTAEFARREKAFPDFERAVAWQNDRSRLRKLLRDTRC